MLAPRKIFKISSELVRSATVTVTLTDLSSNMTNIQIVATGRSDDGTAVRQITQTIMTINPLPNAPDNPVITRGSMVIGGSATVHNPEGHSTIWSGDDVDLGSNNSTATEIADSTQVSYPGCMYTPMTCSWEADRVTARSRFLSPWPMAATS